MRRTVRSPPASRACRLNRDGDHGFFGLAAENSTDNTAVIEFFSPERERFLEYDLSKLVWTLNNPKKRVIGLISGVPLNGSLLAARAADRRRGR